MTYMSVSEQEFHAELSALKASGQPYAIATIVRTLSVTAAKAGAKALIGPDGTLISGWIGGGCVQGAVRRGAVDAFGDGQSRLISIRPEDILAQEGIAAGEERDGIRFARNMCPSRGTVDVFIEPVFPAPHLSVYGASPVAKALTHLAPQFGFAVDICTPASGGDTDGGAADASPAPALRYIVVATQGRGDMDALRAALTTDAGYRAFVGSRAKLSNLCGRLMDEGLAPTAFEGLRGPAGLDIGAITPEEIALSILAEMIAHRRRGARQHPPQTEDPTV